MPFLPNAFLPSFRPLCSTCHLSHAIHALALFSFAKNFSPLLPPTETTLLMSSLLSSSPLSASRSLLSLRLSANSYRELVRVFSPETLPLASAARDLKNRTHGLTDIYAARSKRDALRLKTLRKSETLDRSKVPWRSFRSDSPREMLQSLKDVIIDGEPARGTDRIRRNLTIPDSISIGVMNFDRQAAGYCSYGKDFTVTYEFM